MTRPAALVCLAALAIVAGCGGEIEVPKEETANHEGAVVFNERCSGCHSLDAANAYGSKASGQLEGGEVTNGPNFNVRKESKDDVLFAIRNGGFSGADHAGQHRGGQGRRAGRELPRQVLRQGERWRGRDRVGPVGQPLRGLPVLDLRQIRDDPQPARDALARRKADPALLDEALELDERRRALLPELEELRRRKNEASERIGDLQRSGEDAAEAIAEVQRGLRA